MKPWRKFYVMQGQFKRTVYEMLQKNLERMAFALELHRHLLPSRNSMRNTDQNLGKDLPFQGIGFRFRFQRLIPVE
jgi:hypothetical protein